MPKIFADKKMKFESDLRELKEVVGRMTKEDRVKYLPLYKARFNALLLKEETAETFEEAVLANIAYNIINGYLAYKQNVLDSAHYEASKSYVQAHLLLPLSLPTKYKELLKLTEKSTDPSVLDLINLAQEYVSENVEEERFNSTVRRLDGNIKKKYADIVNEMKAKSKDKPCMSDYKHKSSADLLKGTLQNTQFNQGYDLGMFSLNYIKALIYEHVRSNSKNIFELIKPYFPDNDFLVISMMEDEAAGKEIIKVARDLENHFRQKAMRMLADVGSFKSSNVKADALEIVLQTFFPPKKPPTGPSNSDKPDKPNSSNNSSPPSPGNNTLWIVLAVVGVLLIAIGVGLYFLFNKK